jgi:hypothetical protein
LQLYLGNDVSLFPLYMLGILGLSWEFGLTGAITSISISSILWMTSNYILDVVFENSWAIYYNTAARTLVFIATAYHILMFRRVISEHRRRIEGLRALLNVCHGCGAIQGPNGHWIPFDKITDQMPEQSNECPACNASGSKDKAPTPSHQAV